MVKRLIVAAAAAVGGGSNSNTILKYLHSNIRGNVSDRVFYIREKTVANKFLEITRW